MGTDIFEKIDVHLQNHRMGTWTGTFRDYLGMVIKQPSLAQRAHARLYNMIRRTGVQSAVSTCPPLGITDLSRIRVPTALMASSTWRTAASWSSSKCSRPMSASSMCC